MVGPPEFESGSICISESRGIASGSPSRHPTRLDHGPTFFLLEYSIPLMPFPTDIILLSRIAINKEEKEF